MKSHKKFFAAKCAKKCAKHCGTMLCTVFTYSFFLTESAKKASGKMRDSFPFYGNLYLGKPVALILPVPDSVDIALAHAARDLSAVIL